MSARIIDDVRCPECRSATLVTDPDDGPRFRYCSYVSCSWGIDSNVPYEGGHIGSDAREAAS